MTRSRHPRLWHAAAWLAAAAALGAVFLLYGRPDMMVTLSQQIWACFGH
ncbi:MAG: hypothetical protein GAK30_02949 [Paracidovorax wautersii]|uniref:Uncharacterized protein n=1 Tax=Paracidovorax wautersii TaxID=1177982 RepID=A0A7V8FLY8_9BURK|nr:MAG: hypothetical protein GAK30_02949 [Paracidovorax wautersii]